MTIRNYTKELGVYNEVDWAGIIKDLEGLDGNDSTTDLSKWNLETPGYSGIFHMWKDANFNLNAIKWTSFYPGDHWPMEVCQQVADHLGVSIHRSSIVRMDPGFMAPWHWDVDDNENEYKKKGEMLRFTCFIEPPSHGHLFIVGDDYYFNQPLGTMIQWHNYKEWHSGINAGLKTKWLFHLLAYAP